MSSRRSFKPIEGLRVFMNIWVVLLHVVQIYCYSFNMDINKVLAIKNSHWQGAIRGYALQVDAFFVISGFITGHMCISSILSEGLPVYQLPRRILLLVMKKFFRLWPAAAVTLVVAFSLTDIGLNPLAESLFRIFSFQVSEEKTPFAFVVTWSNYVDIVCSVIIFSTVYTLGPLLKSQNGFRIATLLALVSTAPCVYVHLTSRDPPVSALVAMQQNDSHILLSMVPERCEWLKARFDIDETTASNSVFRSAFGHQMYLPWWTRCSPFFIGLALAVRLWQDNATTQHSSIAIRKDPPRTTTQTFYLIFCALMFLFPAILGVLTSSAVSRGRQAPSTPPSGSENIVTIFVKGCIDLFLTALIRPVFAVCTAYILYCCLQPRGHPLALPQLTAFLSCDLFQTLGKYTYSVYVLHYRILLELIYGILPHSYLQRFLGPVPGLLHVAVYGIVTLSICIVLAYPTVHYLEQPFTVWTNKLLAKFDNVPKVKSGE